MTNKLMLSVDRELLESFAAYVADCPSAVMRARVAQLRAILGKPEYPRVSIVKAHAPTCACVVGDSGQCDCGAVVDGVAVEVKQAAPTQRDRFEVQCAKRMVLPVENVTAMRDGDTYTVHAVASHYRTFQAAEQPAPVAVVLPFAEKVIAKLQRFEACVSDGQDVDIDRHWFDVLTQLGLLNRVQRSPAYWEITQQGEDALEAIRLNTPQ